MKKTRRKPGPKPGTIPKNYEFFRERAKATRFAPGFKGQSLKQVKETEHLREWLETYDKPQPAAQSEPIAPLNSGESLPCPPKIDRRRKIKIPPPITHADRVQEMLAKLRPSREKFLDNDPDSLIKNFKG